MYSDLPKRDVGNVEIWRYLYSDLPKRNVGNVEIWRYLSPELPGRTHRSNFEIFVSVICPKEMLKMLKFGDICISDLPKRNVENVEILIYLY